MVKVLLWPFSLLYGVVTFIRNKFFDWGILPVHSFDIPVISVGNLNTGGTGKTPHVEYLIRLLKQDYRVAVLSRGYKRSTSGFVLADKNATAGSLGDEPFQYFTKFNDIQVAVDEKRVRGIKKLLDVDNPPEVILLDDAFQHRYVKPGFSVLLTDFYNLYPNDLVLPAGSLREFKSGAKRADLIMVTKSPKVLSPFTYRRINGLIKPAPHQQLMFSYLRHGKLRAFPDHSFSPMKKSQYSEILLVAGIANPYPLEAHLRDKANRVTTLKFKDHHDFTPADVEKIIETFDGIFVKNKVIVTTEKDMVRFRKKEIFSLIKDLPICYIPVEIKIHSTFAAKFEQQILKYVGEN